jgi:hypothetical protein
MPPDCGRQVAAIIRNRAKIQATVDNARAMLSASPSLAALAKSYEITRKRAPRSLADVPTTTPQAEAFAKQLKSQGYRFVGPTSVYAFMQNVGVVNDHTHGCFPRDRLRRNDLAPLRIRARAVTNLGGRLCGRAGQLPDEGCERHVECGVELRGDRTAVVLEDLDQRGRVVGQHHAGGLHAQ